MVFREENIMDINEVITKRNKKWKDNEMVPKWVQLEETGLDQFFTKKEVAQKYYDKMLVFLKEEGINIDECLFIEPSAGDGSFFELLPPANRIGLDIYPMCEDIKQADFLSWEMPTTDKKVIFIGNPPFGYRGWLALSFMNHAAIYADYIFFVLPMSFQSDGKGSPKYRVQGMRLIYSEHLPSDSFYEPDGKLCKVNALWQVWKKGENKRLDTSICSDYIELFTVDQRKERLCGQEKMKYADYFLQRTYYSIQPGLVKDFSKVKYVCGYGMIFKKNKKKIKKILDSTNWDLYSNLATHNCRHISMYHIEKALLEGGLLDEQIR